MINENKGPESIQAETIRCAVDAYVALSAAIDRGGYDVCPCRFCGSSIVCIPDGLAICRDCETVSDEPSKAAEETWHYEDKLPSGYDYGSNFDRSKVVDGVRMFPAIPRAAE